MFPIDRERFLVLTAALAASVSACATTPPTTPAPEPLVIPPLAPRASASVATSSSVPTPRHEPPREEPREEPAATGTPDPYAGTPVHGQSCAPAENTVGIIPACAIKAPGPTCESIDDTKAECPTLTRLLKPRVAAAAIACLNRRSGTRDICEFNVSSICAYEALGSACLDPAASAPCARVMARCGTGSKMSRSSCEAGYSAIVESKRSRFLSCITESCRFETCLTYL